MVSRLLRRALVGVAAGSVLALVGAAGQAQASPPAAVSVAQASTAQASTVQAEPAAGIVAPDVAVTPREAPPAGYVFVDEYFWHSDCENVGRAGLNNAWTAYVCINGSGSPFDDYELWVKPK